MNKLRVIWLADDCAAMLATPNKFSSTDIPFVPKSDYDALHAELDAIYATEVSSYVQYSLGNAPKFIPVIAGKTFVPIFGYDFSPLIIKPTPPSRATEGEVK